MANNPKRTRRFFAAVLLSLANAVILWAAISYAVYGIAGEIPSDAIHLVTISIGFMLMYGWSTYGSKTAAEVVYLSCRLGMILVMLIPVSTITVSALWAFDVSERAGILFSDFTMLEIPVLATTAAILLVLIYLGGSYLAAKYIDRVPF